MHTPTIAGQLADIRRQLDLADHLDRSDYRLIGCLLISLNNLADIVERQEKRLADLEQRSDEQYRRTR